MGKKVISFSLYGKHPDYTLGAIANARHANRAYPSWVCRFYVADDVPEGVISRLKDYDAEIVSMGRRVGHEAMFWRFLATVDQENDIIIMRDSDSRFTKCELLMVNEWLASGKKFHVMREGGYFLPIMGGLWGVRGGIPNFKELLEGHLQSTGITRKGADQWFLFDNLYPQMKGNVFVHEMGFPRQREYFIEETVHPPPPIAEDKRGRFLNISESISNCPLPVGMVMPSRRIFIVFSIYKRTMFSEFFLNLWLGVMEKARFHQLINTWFYVADDISPVLIKRLQRYGRVILKPAKTVYSDDPQYWKLLILSEKNLGMAVIGDFWQTFFLVRSMQRGEKIRLYELLPIEHGLPSGARSWFTNVAVLSVCVLAPPVSDMENLVARRDPNENYREFIRSTVYPRISTTRMMSLLMTRDNVGFLIGFIRIFLPSWFYAVGVRVRRDLKTQMRKWRQDT